MAAPPTKVQNFLVSLVTRFLRKKGEVDSIDDSNLFLLDHHSIDHRTQNLTTHRPVRRVQVGSDRRREIVQASQRLTQGRLLARLRCKRGQLQLQLFNTTAGSLESWVKLAAVQDAIGISINQTIDTSLRRR